MIPYNPQGLTPEEVAASRAAHGENIITPQRDDSAWRLLAEKFRDPIIIVLLVAAALSLAMATSPKPSASSAPSCWPPAWDFSSSGTPCGGSAGSTV